MTDTASRDAAALLARARHGARLRDLPPELVPTTLQEAYAIQDVTIGSQPVGAWKVAPARGAEQPRCAAIESDLCHSDGAFLPWPGDRVPEVEVEIALRLAADLPPLDRPLRRDEVAAAIGSVHVAIEVLSSRFVDRKAVHPFTALADQQSCAAVVLGSGSPLAGAPEFASVAFRVSVDGTVVPNKPNGPATSVVLDTLTWLADHAARRRGGLKTGDIVITGARVGPFPVRSGSRITAEAMGVGRVDLTFSQ